MCARSVTGSKHGTEANARPQSQPLHFTSYLLLAASGMCLSLQGHLKLECCHDLPLLVWPPVSKAAAGIAGPPCAARLIRVSEANFLRASWAPRRSGFQPSAPGSESLYTLSSTVMANLEAQLVEYGVPLFVRTARIRSLPPWSSCVEVEHQLATIVSATCQLTHGALAEPCKLPSSHHTHVSLVCPSASSGL